MKIVARYFFAFILLWCSTAFAAQPNFESNDPYEVLGVDPTIDNNSLTAAWRELARAHHPDAGGSLTNAQSVNEAYQFLQRHRVDYNRRLYPFRGQFKNRETQPVPMSHYEELQFQNLYHLYLGYESRARSLIGNEPRVVFVFYAILNMKGDRDNYMSFKSWQLRAYRDLLAHLKMTNLTVSELDGILLRDPAQALSTLVEHYDNFNVRMSTLRDLFLAYNTFYLNDFPKFRAFLSLAERIHGNERLYERRFAAIRPMILKTIKNWMAVYLDQSRRVQRNNIRLYKRARRLILKLEPLPTSAVTCAKLMAGIPPRIDLSF